ncbi:PIN domain-containing protein [Saccharomonospora sp. NPDC046836]|uniref:type II toxin-antitoxin system VapC family toxin n=1 Tax=Saccharomonospora sp. NPDC046836 TaxID=3156921 RepID=UPI00340BE566
MIICDTAPLVAAALYKDPDHHQCIELFTGLRLANRRMLLPAPIVAEVGYLLTVKAGPQIEANFLRSLANEDFEVVPLATADYDRMAELVERYADMPLGTSDASVIALAERLNIAEVATLDRRHFTVVRPRHVQALTLLP